MAAWRDPYHYQAYVYLLQPAAVFQAQVTTIAIVGGPGGSSLLTGVNIDVGTIIGAHEDTKEGMTILVGSSQGGDDKGRARIKSDGGIGGTFFIVHCSLGTHDGELNPAVDDWVTILNDYRIWMKPPYAPGGGPYYYDGLFPASADQVTGKTVDQQPIANAGPGYADFIDSGTGKITVSFSGADSFAMADDAVLGAYTADLFGGAEALSASSGTPGDAIDGNDGTYWQPDTTAHEWIEVDWGDSNEQTIRKFTITGNTTNSPQQFALQWSDDDTNWVTAFFDIQTGWGATEQRTFTNHHAGEHRYWRIFVHANEGGGSLRIAEWEMFAEDRTSGGSPWSWDVDDGTITVGSVTTQDITATFPTGFRYVRLEITDTNAEEGVCVVPVAAVDPGGTIVEADYSGGTPTASTGTASQAFDNDTNTFWVSDVDDVPAWLQMQFLTGQTVLQYTMNQFLLFGVQPTAWIVKGSNNGVDYDTLDTQTGQTWNPPNDRLYVIASPASYTYYRIEISASTGNQVGINEWDLMVLSDPSEGLIESVEIVNQTLEPFGQTLELAVHEDIDAADYPDGTLIMMWEREVYDGVAGSLSAAGPSDREHMKFLGWLDIEPAEIEGTEFDTIKTTQLRCIDAGQRLLQLTGFPTMAERDAVPVKGYEMKHSNLDTLLYLMIRWLSTAAEVVDYIPSLTTDHYNFGVLATNGASIHGMINQRAAAMDHMLTCNKVGQIKIIPNLLTCSEVFSANATTFETITAADYTRITYQRQRSPRIYWLDGSGVGTLPYDADHGSFAVTPEFAVSPGDVPGQGAQTSDDGEQVAPLSTLYSAAQITTDIPQRTGKRYAQDNAPNSSFEIELVHAGDTGIDPAEAQWLKLTIPASVAAQRGLTLNAQQGVVRRVTINHDHEAMTKTVILEWEMQEVSVDGWVQPDT